MLKSYFIIALRNLWKYKSYSFINVAGLAIGIACCVLILLFVRDELSYDRYHHNAHRTYRVTREWFNNDGTSSLHLARVAPPIGPLLQHDFPEIVQVAARISADFQTLLRHGDNTFVEERFFWAEPGVFDVFSVSVIAGDLKTALRDPNSLVLTETMAKKYFGDDDAIGQMINYEGERDLQVTAVVRDVPSQSHFKFDFLASFITLNDVFGEEYLTTNWGGNNYATYLLLPDKYPVDEFASQLLPFIDRHLTQRIVAETGETPERPPSEGTTLHLQRMTDIHLRSHLNSEFEANGSINNVYLFTVIAGFILLIACINFMNLATARATTRMDEIGLRKVLGAYRWQLIRQFIGESLLISTAALAVAIILIELAMPSLNRFLGKELSMDLAADPILLSGLLALAFTVGLISGSYPAFYLSAFEPIAVMKGSKSKGTRGAYFRRVLVVSQFTVSIVLIICLGIVYNQMEYLRNKSLGLNKEHVVILPSSREIAANLESFKNQLLQNPNIVSVATSKRIPSGRLLDSWGARTVDSDRREPLTFRLAMVPIDHDFLDTYQIKLAAGRNFSREFASDDTAAFIINDIAVQKLGWGSPAEAIGKALQYGDRLGTVIGVTENFHFESLHNEIVPLLFLIMSRQNFVVSVRIKPENISATLDFLKGKWTEYRAGYPFTYEFLDDRFDELYHSEQRLGQIFGIFALLAVLIACLGLFGLATYAAGQRTKEVGIRKALGASVLNVVTLLSKDFLKLVLFAGVIASVVGYVAMNRWLQEFAYRGNISFTTFALAILLAMVIALLTTSTQAWKAARSNPVEALKYE